MDELASTARDTQDPWEAYDIALQVAGYAVEWVETVAGAAAHSFWTALSDLYDNSCRDVLVPPEGAHAVLRAAASQWLATSRTDRPDLASDWSQRDLVSLVASLGYALPPAPDAAIEEPWRGKWGEVDWARRQIGTTHSAYAAAQHVIRQLGSDPVLIEAGGVWELSALLLRWDAEPLSRPDLDEVLTEHLERLAADDVPPLRSDEP